MPAVSKSIDWVSIEGEYRAGVKPITAIATAHGISHTAINKRAKARGWARDPAAAKRKMVEAHFSGVQSARVSPEVSGLTLETIEDAAREDIADMERGLRINRHCLMALEQAAETVADPKQVGLIVGATSAAIDSIRRIRGLDDDKPPVLKQATAVATGQRLADLSDEELDLLEKATALLGGERECAA
jgi:hypothetical protein